MVKINEVKAMVEAGKTKLDSFPGVYDTVSKEINRMSKEMF